MSTLKEVWHHVEWMHSQGVSLIPVRDKTDERGIAKTPYRGWKEYQTIPITIPHLWHQMEDYSTNGVALIAGAVSGGLEIIDIDVKYKPGIDAVILSDLSRFYPTLFNSLRIHKTPSGGYHILYRTATNPIPGNQKLAGRNKTDAELAIQPKPKQVNFIETRGEGGYAVVPPSLGYSVHQDQPIPLISWEDRCSIINLCKSYSEIIEIVKPPRQPRSGSEYYDENPYAHFDKSDAAEQVMINNGWKEYKSNAQYIYYTRPGKDSGISATFNKKTRCYYNFTASTELDEKKGYLPATLLTILQFNNDYKASYRWLVQQGYGVIKKQVEDRLVKNNAQSGRPLPPNVSQSATINYNTELVNIQTTFPYGIFWEWDSDNQSYKISREKLYVVAEGLGWRLYQNGPVLINGYIVSKSDERSFYDHLKSYIKEEDHDTYISIANTYEAFIQKNGSFTITRLQHLDESKIVKDTTNSAYKFYNNGYLFITSQAYHFNTYDTLSGLIWSDTILPRHYHPSPEQGRYVDFIKLATPYDTHSSNIRKIIGYLAHQYKDETTGYIIVLTESCPDPKQGGGSGKNLFCNLLKHTTSYKSVPGSQVRYDEKFMQAWNGERIFAVSDAPKKFEFGFLKELSTGEGILKKLFKDEIAVSVPNMPKFIIQTNFSYDVTDGGLKRRIIPIEFTDFFTKAGGVDVHFGCLFPQAWELDDWTGYDNFIAGCLRDWLAGGLKLHAVALTEGGWSKQFEQSWGSIITAIIEEHIPLWMTTQWVSNEVMKSNIDDFYRENNTPIGYRPAMAKITNAIKEYCSHHGKQMVLDLVKKENGIAKRFKWFGNQEDTPF